MKKGYVYILASKSYGTLYIGVTSNLTARIDAHKNNILDSFTQKHQVHILVYYEEHGTMIEAIAREKAMKKWNRAWKINLINSVNSEWRDLSIDL